MTIKPWIAEFLGTFFLVLAGSGAAQMAVNETLNINLLAGAIAAGAVLYIFITLFSSLSGAHFNPAVSLAFYLNQTISAKTFIVYVIAQITGGIFGALSVHYMFSIEFIQMARPMTATAGHLYSELLMSSGLIFIIFYAIKIHSKQIPALVGLFVAAGYFMSASSVVANPAVTIARFLTEVPTSIGMPKALYFIGMQFLAAPLVVFGVNWSKDQ